MLYKVTADDGDCDVSEVDYTVSVKGSDAKVDCAANKGATVAKVVSIEDSATAKCASKQEFPFVNKKRDITVCITPNV